MKIATLVVLLFVQAALYAQTSATYSKGANIQVFWNTGTASMLCGSATKTVDIIRYSVGGIVPHTTGQLDQSLTTEIVVYRVSGRPNGGTFTPRHGTTNDSADTTQSSALMYDYHTPATDLGIVVEGPDAFYLTLPSGNNPTFALNVHDIAQGVGGKPFTLHGVNDCIVMWVNRDYYVTDNDTMPVQSYILAFRAEWVER